MATSKQIHRLATRPQDYIKFMTTGRLPRGVKPESPLIDLLRGIDARMLGQIIGLTVGSALGYAGSRQFHTAAQALLWVSPADEVFDSFPAESWRIKNRPQGPLMLNDLLAHASNWPESLVARHLHLVDKNRPMPQHPNAVSAAASPAEGEDQPAIKKVLRP